MLCQDCKISEATIHYFESSDGKKVDLDLCERCAEKHSGVTASWMKEEKDLPPHSDKPLKYEAPKSIGTDGHLKF